MRLSTWKIILAALAVASLFLVSCDEESTEPEPTVFTPEPPTNLVATSIDNQTVRIKWDHSVDVNNAEFDHYELTVVGGGPTQPEIIGKNNNLGDISGLDEGTIYTFELRSVSTEGELSTAATVQWSPAGRYTFNEFDEPIKVYNSNSTFGSGLNLYDEDTQTPTVWKVKDGEKWDLGLDTRDNGVKLGSAKLINYNYTNDPVNTVEISSEVITGVNSLDEVFDSQALNTDPTKFQERIVDLTQYSENIVLIVRRMIPQESEYHYAKVFIPYQNGSFLTYDAGLEDQTYINAVVSYQMGAGVPYAMIKKEL